MLKKSMFFVAVASMVMATSCSQEDLATTQLSSNEISVNPSMGLKTRAVETTISNLGSFTVNAFQDGAANYMDGVKYTSKDGSVWNTDAGKFYWPVEGKLHFYAFAPNEPRLGGTLKLDKDAQTLTGWYPNTDSYDQEDFVYATATGDMATNGKTGIDLTFQHALSEITIAAKNTNTAYTVQVTGVKIGNVSTKGDFTFPSTSGAPASWNVSTATEDIGDYKNTWEDATTLGNDVSTLNAKNVPFMIIPQQLEKADKASEKAYIAVKVKITMQGGQVVRDGWSYVGIDTNWEMGKRYAYTLDYSNGAGQDENGNKIISGQEIKLNCSVTPWDESREDINFTEPHVYNANSVIMKLGDLETVYGIDITRANVFWSNPDVGDAANVITDDTEWTAEIIWQDIDHRAINFCDANGKIIKEDTFNGIGKQPLYIKAATSTSGNIVVGVKKKGFGTDAYLWSWHLWLTEEPQEIAGFMDRNLGATSSKPSDGSKTYGLYYQFGRKDPFVRYVDIYNINGRKIQTGMSKGYGYVTFARAVKSPQRFYTEPNSTPYDWASPNNYTDKNWNDITGIIGKSLFDPSPSGWKLAEETAYSKFSIYTFLTDKTNNGKMYKSNWFPASGHLQGSAGSYTSDSGYGGWWSETPSDSSFGIGLYYADNNYANYVIPDFTLHRANAFPVRCVKEVASN